MTKSIIGKKCTIGNNVIINGSHIMNNVIIKDNCRISNSFIDDNCVISEGSNLHAGTIIAENVKVESGSDLKGRIECSIDNGKSLYFNCIDTSLFVDYLVML